MNILTPFPGSELYKIYNEEGRIVDYDWNKYNFCNVVYKPKLMSQDKLQNGYNDLAKQLKRYMMHRMIQRVATNRNTVFDE